MKRKSLRLFLLATVLGSFLATADGTLAQKPISTTAVTIQTLTQQIASLEVQRALLNARFTSQSPVVQDVERKLRSVQQHLTKLQPNGNKAAVSAAIKAAISTKIGELEAERIRLVATYIPEHPTIQLIDSQLRSLRKRLVGL